MLVNHGKQCWLVMENIIIIISFDRIFKLFNLSIFTVLTINFCYCSCYHLPKRCCCSSGVSNPVLPVANGTFIGQYSRPCSHFLWRLTAGSTQHVCNVTLLPPVEDDQDLCE